MSPFEEPHAAFYAGFACSILRDDVLKLYSPKDLSYDTLLITSRVSYEGLSFLTKTLPSLGKAVLAGLESGMFPTDYRGFTMSSAGRPLFLGAYLDMIFTESYPDYKQAIALKFVLQVCFHAYKLELPLDPSLSDAVIGNFIATEQSLAELTIVDWVGLRHAQSIIEDVFDGFDPKDIHPKHGPGSVATGEKLWSKWSFKRLYDQIHQQYPYYDYFFIHSKASIADQKKQYLLLQRLTTGVAEVVLVPKDSRGPRLISKEPLEYQFIQQGLGNKMTSWLENCALTKGHVNFTDQSINRNLAQTSSFNQKYTTMDLKDASDRVTVKLVEHLFGRSPRLLACLLATRSTSTLLPSGEILPLVKFAPMGSSLCFPVEAICFWSICVGAAMATGLTREQARNSVYIYGDDIIIDTCLYGIATKALEAVGLLVNTAKCYSRGFFRESCGMDAFKGIQVTPIRLKEPFSKVRSAEVLASYTSKINALRSSAYEQASQYLISNVEKVYGPIPFGLPTASYPCIHVDSVPNAIGMNKRRGIKMRWNSKTCHVEVKVFVPRPVTCAATHSGWKRVLQNLLQPVRDQSKWAIRRMTSLSRRWRSVGG